VGTKALFVNMRPSEKSQLQADTAPFASGLLYRLSIAFTTWAGAALAVYSILLRSGNILKLRLK
jgi:hypothetical protein